MSRIKIVFGKKLLYPVDTEKYCPGTPAELAELKIKSLPASVPGNAELDLERAGVLPELFRGTNILRLEEYELYDYWYLLTFLKPEGESAKTSAKKRDRTGSGDAGGAVLSERQFLLFEGVDTLADVWLNGELLGSADNMFIPCRFDVTGRLKEENELYVRIKNPVRFAEKKEYDTGLWGLSYNAESVHIRKAPHSFGWDICPRAMGGGIFRDVYILTENQTEVENVYLHTLSVDHNGAHVRVSYDLKLPASLYHKTYFQLEGVCNGKNEDCGKCFSAGEKIVFKHGVFNFTVPVGQLALWNPVGYGEPALYFVTARIKNSEGEILAEKNFRFGIRTLALEFDPTGEEKKFLFRVNGVPIMCKGTNWAPLDAFHSRDGERMERALALLSDCGCNIVRCWGGNIYEDEEFFDYCDLHGILVWQDFAMACNLYPSDADFCAALEKEVGAFVRRVRGHASLACYCGDNECDLGMFFNGIDPTGYKITRKILPGLLFRFDPFRRFLPSSPYFAGKALWERDEQALSENHLWGPRNNFKSRFYLENKNAFVSEIGYHGCPAWESVKKFIPEESLWPWENDDWMAHQTAPGGGWTSDWNRIKLMAYQVRELFGYEPETPEEFVFCSQVSQAEALKFFVESARLNKWEKTGVIWWNLLDCWPQFSDAVVDYYFVKKLAYYYLSTVQRPLCFMLEEPTGWAARAVIGNDGNRDFSGKYEIFEAFGKKIVAEGEFFSRANENSAVCEVPLSKNIPAYFILRLTTADGENFVNHYVHAGGALKADEYRRFLAVYAEYVRSL